MDKTLKNVMQIEGTRPAGCPKCGSLSVIRLRNKNGEVMGNAVVCADCKTPYEIPGE